MHSTRYVGRVDVPPLAPPVCGDGCSVAQLVAHYSVANTIIATFTNERQMHFTDNWVAAWREVNGGAGPAAGLLVACMNVQPGQRAYAAFAGRLRAQGVGVYTANSDEVRRQPQGGRWFHVLPLLRTGVRLLLSDSDAVWLRDPLPYLRALEAAHPRMDFAVSSDAQTGTDSRRLGAAVSAAGGASAPSGRGAHSGRRRRRHAVRPAVAEGAATDGGGGDLGDLGDLDVEEFGACWGSMNIGVL